MPKRFEPGRDKLRNKIGDITLTLKDAVEEEKDIPGKQPYQAFLFSIRVLDQYGDLLETVQGNALPYLTKAEIEQLQALIQRIREKAVQEILAPARQE